MEENEEIALFFIISGATQTQHEEKRNHIHNKTEWNEKQTLSFSFNTKIQSVYLSYLIA